MAFQSPLLNAVPSFAALLSGGTPLRPGSSDQAAIRALQKALRALGYSLPKSFPNGYEKDPDGKYGDETAQAVLDLQRKAFPKDPTQWDGRVGKNTIRALDGQLGKAPAPTPPGPKPTGRFDDTIPTGPPYDKIPPDLMTILQRSYRERDGKNQNLADGFDAKADDPNPQQRETFRQVLDRLMAKSSFGVLQEMFDRMKFKTPYLIPKIRWLNEFYDFTTSRGIWVCIDKDAITNLHSQLRQDPGFCADIIVGHSTHQKKLPGTTPTPSQCYRELGVVGNTGLHICLQSTTTRASEFGEWHNIHVDPHQIGNGKSKKCACWYGQTKHHFGDVGKWCVGWFLDNHGKGAEIRALIKLLGADPDNKDDCYQKFMAVVGDYDTFVDMGDHPERYNYPLTEVKKNAVVKLAGLYRRVYLEVMPPQFQS